MNACTHLNRRAAVLGAASVLAVVLALAAVLWLLTGCAPKAESQDGGSAPGSSTSSGADASGASALDGQPVNWTMESDCSTCHTSEAASETDTACPQGTAHKAENVTCAQCHTEESTLKTEHADVKFGDKVATKATVATVDPVTCESCHGTMEDMASKTVDSTALTDDKGTTVNPHERPAGEKHDENPATCTDCHNNHSKDLPKDAMRYCAQCHHRGTFECGTCHELRERSAS